MLAGLVTAPVCLAVWVELWNCTLTGSSNRPTPVAHISILDFTNKMCKASFQTLNQLFETEFLKDSKNFSRLPPVTSYINPGKAGAGLQVKNLPV